MKIKLTGKQKEFRTGSARDLWWREIQKWDGEEVEAWKEAMSTNPPSKPAVGEYSQTGEPPAGWLAFFRSEGLLEKESREWSDDELLSSLVSYADLQAEILRGEKINKKAVYRKLASQHERTEKSFEFRMQNISSVLNDLGLPWIPGLPPARNVGSGVKVRLQDLMRGNALFESSLGESTGDTAIDDLRVAELMTRDLGGPPSGQAKPKTVTSPRDEYVRDLKVKAWVLKQANGRCECCGSEAPFIRHDGRPYLEVHHVRQLARGGSDTTSNAVAVCPNCHRELHFSANTKAVVEDLYVRVGRLSRE